MSSDLRDFDKWNTPCPFCLGRPLHAMGSPPCEHCGGMCKSAEESVSPEDVQPLYMPLGAESLKELLKDLEAFHGIKIENEV